MNSILRARLTANQVAAAARKAADDLIKAVERLPFDEVGILQAHAELRAAATLLGSSLHNIKRTSIPRSIAEAKYGGST